MFPKTLILLFLFQWCYYSLSKPDSFLDNRIKRQDDQDDCLQKCTIESEKNMNNTGNKVSIQHHGNKFHHHHHHGNGRKNVQVQLTMKDDMNTFCQKVFEPLQKCNSNCPGAANHPTFDDNGNLDTVWVMNFMCDHVEGAKKYTACKDKMNGTETDCTALCESTTMSIETTKSPFTKSPEDEASTEISATCQQLKCSIDCQVADVKRKCNDQSAQYLKDMMKAVFLENPDVGKMLNLIQQQSDTGVHEDVPRSCVRLFESLS